MTVATNRQRDHTFKLIISLLMSNTLSSCSCILHCNPIIMFYLGSRVGTEVAKKKINLSLSLSLWPNLDSSTLIVNAQGRYLSILPLLHMNLTICYLLHVYYLSYDHDLVHLVVGFHHFLFLTFLGVLFCILIM